MKRNEEDEIQVLGTTTPKSLLEMDNYHYLSSGCLIVTMPVSI